MCASRFVLPTSRSIAFDDYEPSPGRARWLRRCSGIDADRVHAHVASRWPRRDRSLGRKHSSCPAIVVGCTSSWADPGFIKDWYPPSMPAGERLPWYAQRFEAVELNSSFYAVPERPR